MFTNTTATATNVALDFNDYGFQHGHSNAPAPKRPLQRSLQTDEGSSSIESPHLRKASSRRRIERIDDTRSSTPSIMQWKDICFSIECLKQDSTATAGPTTTGHLELLYEQASSICAFATYDRAFVLRTIALLIRLVGVSPPRIQYLALLCVQSLMDQQVIWGSMTTATTSHLTSSSSHLQKTPASKPGHSTATAFLRNVQVGFIHSIQRYLASPSLPVRLAAVDCLGQIISILFDGPTDKFTLTAQQVASVLSQVAPGLLQTKNLLARVRKLSS